MTVLVTGAAGFIGFHLSLLLIKQGYQVVGLDNINSYYDPKLKLARLAMLEQLDGFRFVRMDLADNQAVADLFAGMRFRYVVNLAAQAGVRHSLTHPHDYVSSNITGFLNILEGCRNTGVEHLVFASSSSVYGSNTVMPFSTAHGVDHPLSIYAASKRANELMAHTYSHLFNVAATGLRFFTVYGPWGRPDMAMYIFAQAIRKGEPIRIFNHGDMQRDFTYVDDIVDGVARLLPLPPAASPRTDGAAFGPNESHAPFRVFNIGNDQPTELLRVIEMIEEHLGRKAVRHLDPMQPGDVKATWADVDDLASLTGFKPATPIETGVKRFIDWYKDYHDVA
ncbi:MAG: NAD-dependent epimerase [Sphingomonadaceae bacterium]